MNSKFLVDLIPKYAFRILRPSLNIAKSSHRGWPLLEAVVAAVGSSSARRLAPKVCSEAPWHQWDLSYLALPIRCGGSWAEGRGKFGDGLVMGCGFHKDLDLKDAQCLKRKMKAVARTE